MRRWTLLIVAALVAQTVTLAVASDQPVRENDVVYRMDDGVRLLADRWVPYDLCPCPTMLTFNPYGTNEEGIAVTEVHLAPTLFVAAGYAVVVVDVRGTGQSEGVWGVLNSRERKDFAEVIRQIAVEPWSDGSVVTVGQSYGGISALMAAEEPNVAPLKAVFSLVPMADAYRDILSSGGSSDIEFLGMWSVGMVGGPGAVQPLLTRDAQIAINAETAHALNLATLIPQGNVGYNMGEDRNKVFGEGDPESPASAPSFDGPFYDIRSPLDRIDQIRVPVFLVGADLDLFQRTQPLLFNALPLPEGQKKLVMMPGYHGAAIAAGNVDDHGNPVKTIRRLALEWFERWVRGVQNGIDTGPAIQRWYSGANAYVAQRRDPPAATSYQRWYLGTGSLPVGGGSLSTEAPSQAGSTPLVFHPFQGACSRTTIQYLYGAVPDIPCSTDNTASEAEGATFTSPAFDAPYVLTGPMSMHVWLRSTRPDTNLVAVVSDVGPDGSTTAYTFGAQVASLRKLTTETCRTPVVNGCSVEGEPGEYIMPWHPFTEESIEKLEAGAIYDMWVEINPVALMLKPGHQLRVTLKSSDFPHTLTSTSVLRDAVGGVTEILTGPGTPSYLYVGRVPGGLEELKQEYDTGE